MRTDVKIGLVCAFVIVMGAVIYFVAQPAHPAKPKTTTDSLASGTATQPATAPATAPSLASGSMGGPFILPPGSSSPMAGGSAGGPSSSDTVGGSTASAGAAGGFGSGYGAPSMSGTPTATGTPAAAGSGSASTGMFGTPSASFGTSPSASTGNGTSSRGTIDLSGASCSPFGAFGGSSASAGSSGSSAGTTGTTYVIQKSDMLGPIAHHFGVTVSAILAANPGIDPNHLKIKTVINIPAGTTAPTTAPSAKSGSHGEVAVAAAAPGAAKPGASYKIRKSDTLMTIARSAYGSEKDWKRIYNANKSEISDPNLVPVGLVIKIPQ